MGRRGDPGEIQGRPIDLWGYGVQECWRRRNEGEDEDRGMRTRISEGESCRCLVGGSDKGG